MRLFIPDIPMPDLAAQEAAREHLRHQPALGTLGVLAVRLAAMTGSLPLTFPRKGVVVLAADHGHIPLGEETAAEGNAATHILARQAGATVTTVDIGLRRPWPPAPHHHSYNVAKGTRHMGHTPALGIAEVHDALTVGMNIASQEIAQGVDVLAVGSASAGGEIAAVAVAAVLLNQPPAALLPENSPHLALISEAIALHQPNPQDVLDVLRCVGGLELAGMAGVILGAAAGRVPIVLDDLASAVAALVASELAFQVRPYLIAGHATAPLVLRRLGLRPLLDVGVENGRATSAILAFHLIEAAARLHNELVS
ncbi:MAG: nicotinate-nucleotide--dimethylbenzimidazole phosphoribosyltransferase [Chloroflexi bacterium]|nr:nicotinate-nucleotide--dimethylbenzimidazole phosphoribosyltransferase [Chloroflexota bacterium]